MTKAKHSLIRIERIDGETAVCGMESSDEVNGEWELLAMMGDGLALWLTDNPDKHRAARKFYNRVFRDFCPDWIAYWIDGWAMRLLGVCGLFAALYGFAALMQKIGGALL